MYLRAQRLTLDRGAERRPSQPKGIVTALEGLGHQPSQRRPHRSTSKTTEQSAVRMRAGAHTHTCTNPHSHTPRLPAHLWLPAWQLSSAFRTTRRPCDPQTSQSSPRCPHCAAWAACLLTTRAATRPDTHRADGSGCVQPVSRCRGLLPKNQNVGDSCARVWLGARAKRTGNGCKREGDTNAPTHALSRKVPSGVGGLKCSSAMALEWPGHTIGMAGVAAGAADAATAAAPEPPPVRGGVTARAASAAAAAPLSEACKDSDHSAHAQLRQKRQPSPRCALRDHARNRSIDFARWF